MCWNLEQHCLWRQGLRCCLKANKSCSNTSWVFGLTLTLTWPLAFILIKASWKKFFYNQFFARLMKGSKNTKKCHWSITKTSSNQVHVHVFAAFSDHFEFVLLVSGLARIISLVLAHILHSAENHSWTLIVLLLKLKRHFLKSPSFEKRKTLSILSHSESLWRSCKREGHPTTKCFQICQKSLNGFFYALGQLFG